MESRMLNKGAGDSPAEAGGEKQEVLQPDIRQDAGAAEEPMAAPEAGAAPEDAVAEEPVTASEAGSAAASDEAAPDKAVPEDAREEACRKLQEELGAAEDKSFAKPVIGYLLKRCREDNGLAQDVLQTHKTWEKCFQYIYRQARRRMVGGSAHVPDEVVYEWAEDYYHRDDKAEEEKKPRETAVKKEKAVGKKKEAPKKKAGAGEKQKSAEGKKEPAKPKSTDREMEGQLDMFSMMEL